MPELLGDERDLLATSLLGPLAHVSVGLGASAGALLRGDFELVFHF